MRISDWSSDVCSSDLRGGNLSVGERQLVALVRAQLGDPGLLVLDEATSSVDPETEQVLARALDRLTAGRTVVSIAHRLSTAEHADLVSVVDAGRIVSSEEDTSELQSLMRIPYAVSY